MSPYPSPLMSCGTGSAVAPAVPPVSVVAATVIAAVAARTAKRLVRAVCPAMCVVPPTCELRMYGGYSAMRPRTAVMRGTLVTVRH
ncbi:hypothetical protein GCM10010221_25780 [Streptomyces parvus]|nr:hypothetical protein GCM10010221_25780 [Streptomyces parvus]